MDHPLEAQPKEQQMLKKRIEKNVKNKQLLEKDILNITFEFSSKKMSIRAHKDVRFMDILGQYGDFELSSDLRFFQDGSRIQLNLSLAENGLQNENVIDVYHEMTGGRGPNDEKILEMLDNYESEEDDMDDSSEETATESDDVLSSDEDAKNERVEKNQLWFEDIKQQYKSGMFKLDSSKPMDSKLIFHLEAEKLQSDEILRLKNIFDLWKQHKIWEAKESGLENVNVTTNNRKRELLQEVTEEVTDFSTPSKRQRLMKKFNMTTPSPFRKKITVTLDEMKRISVAVHLWAERMKGGIQYLASSRLTDPDFEEILSFTGPGSKWNIMKNRSVPQLRSLWRNTSGVLHAYRGHCKTGFENKSLKHDAKETFCPFGHCKSGIMSPMDVDLVLLTPQKKITNRKLIKEFNSEKTEVFTENTETVLESAEEKNQNTEQIQLAETFNNPNQTENEETGFQLGTSVILQHQQPTEGNEKQNIKIQLEDSVFKCREDGCEKIYTTFFGLEKHYKKSHAEIKFDRMESTCKICLTNVLYLDQHMKAVHKETQMAPTCDVCLKQIESNMKKHRKACIKCLYCDYTNQKKDRLLAHIKNCKKKDIQLAALDLSTPKKKKGFQWKEDKSGKDNQDEGNQSKDEKVEAYEKVEEDELEGNEETIRNSDEEDSTISAHLERGRSKYPFDSDSADEEYYSEIDCDDNDKYTKDRRKIKDELEKELRKIDCIENLENNENEFILSKFNDFMKNKSESDNIGGGFSKMKEVSTVKMYTGVIRNDLLPACHMLFKPFHAKWLLDCKTPKICKFEGEDRHQVSPEEPVYITSRILDESIKKYSNSGGQRRIALAAISKFMEYVEFEFALKLDSFGLEPLIKVQAYHKTVRNFIKGTSKWKIARVEENETHQKNKIIRDHETPHKDAEILRKYKVYMKSDERISKVSKLLSYSNEEDNIPSAGTMTELGINIMEEFVACVGCRPKVPLHLTMGAWVDRQPGFNPHETSEGDSVIEEDGDEDKIFRRVNPNLPPSHKACEHQKKDNSALCAENCEEECKPEGYNILCSWDKTQSKNGSYYLHLPTFIKELMDRYDIVRTMFFKNKYSKFGKDDQWLEDFDTPFFLNSVGGCFQFLNLKKLSDVIGIDVTSYSFRKIVATWGLSHESDEIRRSEETVLQHGNKIATETYLQNKQLVPQKFTQTYAREESLFPEKLTQKLEKDKKEVDKLTKEIQVRRTGNRYKKLVLEKETLKEIQNEKRPLGPRQHILRLDLKQFSLLLEKLSGSKIEDTIANLKPLQWRDFVVRMVCSKNEEGKEMRKLWMKMYQGDLLHGVRDERRKAKDKNWPIRYYPGRKDRNSWITFFLRKSLSAKKKKEFDMPKKIAEER
jgi:hypothetical protein